MHIETFSGAKFYPEKPVFNIVDIAHALSLNCRFNGHTSQFYSLAEHSILVALLCKELALASPFEGLMHDATEAYLTDVPSPIKRFLPDWQGLDDGMDLALRAQFRVGPKTPGCKHADWLALFIEANTLLTSKGATFSDPNGYRAQALGLVRQGWVLPLMDPSQAEQAFLHMYEDYKNK